MLENFFISKVRVKILKLYVETYPKSYHVRDIVRQIDEEVNAVRRELINLEKAGFFQKEPKFNRLYYSLIDSFIFLPEIRALIFKEYGLGAAILKERNLLGEVKYAVLSSGYINNLPMNPNEIDLLIVGEKINMERVGTMIKEIEQINSREINCAVLNQDLFEKEKKRREGYMKNLLDKSKIFIIGNEDAFI